MHTLLVIVHVSMMISSLALMSVAVGMGFFGKKSAAIVSTVGELATVIGGFAGALLLLGAPLSVECAVLTAYLLGVTSLYVFGFGMGNASEARLIRETSS